MNKTLCIFFSLLIYMECSAQAPKLNFRHIGYEKGLSSTAIEAIVQDNRGYMWLGTRDGLNRYDGKEMRVFRNIKNDSTSLSNNYINYLFEDREHKLWVGTVNGLNVYDQYTTRFTRYQHNPSDPTSLLNNTINCLYEDRQNNLWVSSNGGLSVLDRSTGKFTSYRPAGRYPDYEENDKINSILADSTDHLWLATNHGVQEFDMLARAFVKSPFPGRLDSLYIKFIVENEGKLWLGTQNNGLVLFDPVTKAAASYRHDETNPSSLSSDMVESMMKDRAGRLWIGTINGGLNLFNPEDKSFYHYQEEPENSEGLSKRTVTALLQDDEGNFWVGTHRGGVNLFAPSGNKFKVYRQKFDGNYLSYNDVNTFCEEHTGKIWIGTDGGGLNIFDRKNNTFTRYRYDPYNPHTLGADAVTHIMEDSRKDLWVATWDGGLNLFNRKDRSFTRFKKNPNDSLAITSNHVQKTFEDSRGNMWVATYYGGLNKLDWKTRTFRRVLTDPSRQTNFYGNNVVSIDEDKNGHLWFGTDDGGLNCYDLYSQHFYHYFSETQKMCDLRVIFTDSKGRVWVGQEGLYLFDPIQNTFRIYTQEAGLAKAFIKGITEDSSHNLWISTSWGLIRFNPDNHNSKIYNTNDGLQGLEFENNSCMKAKDGEMFFGGINGFNSFYPEQILVNKFIPPVYITELQVLNKKITPGDRSGILTHDISLTGKISLSHTQSSITFNFAALNYTNSDNNQYAYMLEGFDNDWHYSNNDNKANYTNLDPGSYVFHVKASNNDGIWNEKGSSVRIVINPPFWKTGWFQLLVFVVIAGAAYSYYAYRRRLQLKKMEEKKREEILQMQLQFFTNISHEFRTPLTLILGPSEKLLKEDTRPSFKNYYQSIHRNANRLFCLINELMDFRKIEVGALKLHVHRSHLNMFLDEIAEEFYDWAADKSIRFEVKTEKSLPDVWFDRQVLEKIVSNLLSNAFKYTSTGGSVRLEVMESLDDFKPAFDNEMVLLNDYRSKKYVYIRIIDNGIGISKESIRHLFERYYRISDSHLGSGIGLAFVKSLTLLHKGDIYVYSERHRGTEIIIAIPSEERNYDSHEKWSSANVDGNIKLESIHNTYEKEFEAPVADAHKKRDLTKKTQQLKHILITEDNHELRNFLKDCLSPYYTISEAVDGNAGLLKAREESPDLIISDVMMPGMNGNDFCRLIKQHVDTSHIPFMMLTAKGEQLSRLEGVGSGADFYFSKPLSIDLLLLTIRNIFDQNQKLKDHYTKDYRVDAKELAHSSVDKKFMDNLLELIDEHMMDPNLDIDFLCRSISMSRSKLYGKIKAITGQSTGDFIRTARLKKAVEIMLHEDVSILDITCRIGIQTQSYFTKAFKKQYGKTPTQFMQDLEK